MRDSFFHGYRFHLDRLGLGVQRAYDPHFLSREFWRRPLVAYRVEVPAILQTVPGAMDIDAGHSTLGVRRAHLHLGMICFWAIIVRNDAGELLLARGCGQRCNYEKIEDQIFHNLSLFPTSTKST
jgi:hypothetical protein